MEGQSQCGPTRLPGSAWQAEKLAQQHGHRPRVGGAFEIYSEMAQAALLARVVLSHAGCMPSFFAGLFLEPSGHWSATENGTWLDIIMDALCQIFLFALPLMQLGASLLALVTASFLYSTAPFTLDPVSIVINSVALLFTLEVDDWVASSCKRREVLLHHNLAQHTVYLTTRAPDGSQLNTCTYGANAAWCIRYAYTALIGAAFLSAPFFLLFISSVPVVNDQFRLMNASDDAVPALVMLTALYTMLCALLVYPPFKPANESTWWGACHRVTFVVIAAMFCVVQLLANSQSNPTSQDSTRELCDQNAPVMALAVAVLVIAWVGLYVIWPALPEGRASRTSTSGLTPTDSHVQVGMMLEDGTNAECQATAGTLVHMAASDHQVESHPGTPSDPSNG